MDSDPNGKHDENIPAAARDVSADDGETSRAPSYVVGVGASAGGLESLERLFTEMPTDTGLAFVVIQHLSPDFKSLMDELLARYTSLPIHRAEEGMLVEANSVYLIPPRKEMIVSDRRLLLTDKDPKRPLTMPIDRFFRSLAQDFGDRSIGVILSGTGSDGSRGICDIHNAGGLVLCESRESARFDGMPQSAIETGIVDQILPPENMPAALVNRVLRLPFGNSDQIGHQLPAEGIDAVFEMLKKAYSIDFSHYKPNTVSRRIQRRISMVGSRSIEHYAEKLRGDTEELDSLYRDLLIGVTRFFRDREAFEQLEAEVIPDLVRKAAEQEELRIWVAGCATGEEAYSLAMIIHERLEQAGQPINVKIFATDVHRTSLEYASKGIYGESALADVGPDRLQRYFDLKHDGYHVASDLRQMIVFAAHNIISDAPFTRLDLITCRNLLIYLQPVAQRKALLLFHFGLKTGGWLFLGPSESPGELIDELQVANSHWKLYRKKHEVRLPGDLELPRSKGPLKTEGLHVSTSAAPKGQADETLITAYDAILDSHMPPGLLINEKRELLHAFGGAERYLKTQSGRPTGDVLDLFDRELRTAVTGAVQRVLRDGTPVTYSGVRSESSPSEEQLRITVEPIRNPRSRFAQLLILMRPLQKQASEPSGKAAGPQDDDMRRMTADRIDNLEEELRYSRENLQTTIEELETSNEEMQATNEELVASNEELQSTNEELQSVNEELYTVNAEYQNKIAELSELTSDMDNLLESTEIGTIFLDRELKIRKFTPQIGQDFNLLRQDIGRPINSFTHNFVYSELMDDLTEVLSSESKQEVEVQDQQGKWMLLRILPYRTRNRKVDGVVLTLVDISSVKEAQRELAEAVSRRDQFLAMLSHELRNPLGAILNATHVLEHYEFEDPSARDTLKIVGRQGRHMSRLLDDLLDVSRVTQNKIDLHMELTDLQSIIENATDAVRPLVESGELNFTTSVPSRPLLVLGDSARLQQALTNLLSNAARYTQKGGKVTLEAAAEDNHIVVKVRDNGVGIPEDQLKSIFDLFVQSDHSLHRSKGGMGIGLTLVRSIIEMHEGDVSVTSDGPDRGSCFIVRLPRQANIQADGQAPAASPDDEKSLTLRSGSIVIVEDQQDARTMLRTMLRLEGYEVFEAASGTEGLKVIEQVRPAVALVDIGLPGIDGYQVAARLRQNSRNRNTYLVALTGYGRPGDVEEAFEAGFDNHLVKPLDPDKLFQILNTHGGTIEEKSEPH